MSGNHLASHPMAWSQIQEITKGKRDLKVFPKIKTERKSNASFLPTLASGLEMDISAAANGLMAQIHITLRIDTSEPMKLAALASCS